MSEVLYSNEKFDSRLTAIEDTLEKLVPKMYKLYDAVVGNETFDQEGVIARLKKLESQNEKHVALKNKLIGAFIAGGAIWTLFWEMIKVLMRN